MKVKSMQVIGSHLVKLAVAIGTLWLVRLYVIPKTPPATSNEPPRAVELSQQWVLQPGDRIGGYRIAGGLGDISVELRGKPVYAPTAGRVQMNREGCVIFSSDEIPAYLFRFCGLKQPNLGAIQPGEIIGTADYFQFATLRRQPDGKWAFVETSKEMLEKTLQKP